MGPEGGFGGRASVPLTLRVVRTQSGSSPTGAGERRIGKEVHARSHPAFSDLPPGERPSPSLSAAGW